MSDNSPSWPSDDDGTSRPPPPPPPSGGGRGGDPGGAGRSIESATVGIRFGARIIDGFLIGIVTSILGWILGLGATTPGVGSNVVAGLLSVVLALGYYVGMEVTQGATLGKLLLGLRVHGRDGGNPTPEESIKRNVWLAAQILPIIGGLLGFVAAAAAGVTISSSDRNRGWHDDFAGTQVTRG